MPGAGHLLMVQNPTALAQGLHDFYAHHTIAAASQPDISEPIAHPAYHWSHTKRDASINAGSERTRRTVAGFGAGGRWQQDG